MPRSLMPTWLRSARSSSGPARGRFDPTFPPPRPSDPPRALVPSAGAGFVVALCGEMQRMPGLGRTPAFTHIDIDERGETVGLR